MSFMEHQVLGYKSPLHGRRTAQFKLQPFTFWEAALMLPSFNPEERAVLYGVTSGVPEHLSRIDARKSVDANIIVLFFDPSGRLFEESSSLLKQELNDPAVYSAVIKAIADGHSRLGEIANVVSRESSAVTAFVNSLMELELVKKETPVDEKSWPQNDLCALRPDISLLVPLCKSKPERHHSRPGRNRLSIFGVQPYSGFYGANIRGHVLRLPNAMPRKRYASVHVHFW